MSVTGRLTVEELVDTDSDTVMIDRRSDPGAPGFDDHLVLGSGGTLTSPLLPGFELAVDELFDR